MLVRGAGGAGLVLGIKNYFSHVLVGNLQSELNFVRGGISTETIIQHHHN